MTIINLDYNYKPMARWGFGDKSNPHLLSIIGKYQRNYIKMLKGIAHYKKELSQLSIEEKPGTAPEIPFWLNDWFPAIDAMSLYYFLVQKNPRYYFEIGSGFSTKYARKAIKDHNLRTKIISVDPMPRAEIDSICDRVIRKPLEEVDNAELAALSRDDILFIDSSHRAFQNSDVTVFFLEILPILPAGMIFGLHDIFLPDDYFPVWAERWYNEQYLLAAYLLGANKMVNILAANHFILKSAQFQPFLENIWEQIGLVGMKRDGGAFWLQKK